MAYPIVSSVSRRGEVVQTATLGLDRRVTREDLNNNNASLNIKCVASIYTAYYKTVELQASLRIRKKLKRRRENLKKKQQKDKDNQNGKLRAHSSIKMYSIYFQAMPFNWSHRLPLLLYLSHIFLKFYQ